MNGAPWRVFLAIWCAGLFLSVQAQPVCHDWDADGAQAGSSCLEAGDCADLSWARHPGASEVCDGLDSDCDGSLDQGCDRWCEDPVLFAQTTPLPMAQDRPNTSVVCATLLEDGFMVGSTSFVEFSFWSLMSTRVFDRYARASDVVYEMGDPARPEPEDVRCTLAGSEERILAVWQDETDGHYLVKAGVLDRFGRPIAPEIDLTAIYGEEAWTANIPAAAWNGEEFAVFWIPRLHRNRMLMNRVSPDGTLVVPDPVLVTEDIDGAAHFIDSIQAVWTGTDYLVTVGVNVSGIGALVVHADGSSDGEANMLGRTENFQPRLALAGDRAALAWSEFSAPDQNIQYITFLDFQGQQLTPPGVLPLFGTQDLQPADIALAWTGEMVGVVMADRHWGGSEYESSWWMQRVLPDGTLLDQVGRLLSNDPRLEDQVELLWSGEEFWIIGKVEDPGKRLIRARIVCSCEDLDNDGDDACVALDCDDGNPQAHQGAIEQCRGGADEDCDGSIDCDDTDCPSGSGPGPVGDLRWEGESLVWNNVAQAEVYDLARGLVSDLYRRGDLLLSRCSGQDLVTSSWLDDGRRPPPGDALWYAVRPEGAPCHMGSWSVGGGSRVVTACD